MLQWFVLANTFAFQTPCIQRVTGDGDGGNLRDKSHTFKVITFFFFLENIQVS